MESDEIEYDPLKEQANVAKHGIDFYEAASVFMDRLAETIPDRVHSEVEDRYFTMGMSATGKILIVIHTFRDDKIRIISARTADPQERRRYEQATDERP